MGEDLPQIIENAREFLAELKANNNRDWFQDNKKAYEAKVKNPGTSLGEGFAESLAALTGSGMKHKLFRINRDIRFSKDKTPYNTHLHLSWTGGGAAAFMFGVSPDYVTAGAGVFGLQKEPLDRFRAAIDAHGDELSAEIDSLVKQGYRIDEPELKRVPAPYDKDHPHGGLLRRKSLALWRDFDGPVDDVALFKAFEALLPIYRFLNEKA